MYVYANLGLYDAYLFRLLGPGLGNILFPWARAQILSRDFGLKWIEPAWANVRVGSIIRREKDFRHYANLFKPQPGSVTGLNRLMLLSTLQRCAEGNHTECIKKNSKFLIVVRGVGKEFNPILNDHRFIAEKLLEVTRPEHLRGISYDFSDSIVLHIRRGDFKVSNIITPLEWYVRIIHSLREELWRDLRVLVFSDGNDDELMPILSLAGVSRLSFGSSLADLLAMSKARLLVGSRHSTFSRWASYLGRMPSVWPTEEQTSLSRQEGVEIQSETGQLSCQECLLLSSWL